MHADDHAAEERADTRRHRLVWLVAAAMAAAAAGLAGPGLLADPEAALPTWVGIALLAGFAAAEVAVIHLPTQRSSHAHSLREVPAVVGLTFLAPQAYVAVYVVGTVAALVLWTRMRGVKLVFNTCLFALEGALGVLVYHAVLAGGEPTQPQGWLAALVAVLLTDLVSAAAVTAAISLTEGSFDGEVLKEAMRWGLPAACINTCVALLLVTLVVVRPWALVLVGVVVVLLVLGYRVYVGLARGHARTQLLYRFVERTASAQTFPEVVRVALGEATDLMYAEQAYLLEVHPDDPAVAVRCHALADGEVVHSEIVAPGRDAWWAPAATAGSPVLRSRRSGRPRASDDAPHPVADEETPVVVPAHPRDGVAAPLRAGGAVRGVLVVCDRSFEQETFGREDLQVLETLAAHVSVALERADTVERLRRLAEERAFDALHDPLSGLPNRRAFNEAVSRVLEAPGPPGPGRSTACCCCWTSTTSRTSTTPSATAPVTGSSR